MKSRWRDREISVDGRNTEWDGIPTSLEDKKTSVGILNDRNDLYLMLMTADRDLQHQIMGGGLTIWFDRDGGKARKFGIHYPLGHRGLRRPPEDLPQEEGMQNPIRDFPVDSTGDLEIDGPGDEDQHRMTRAEAIGINAQCRLKKDTLVYELKVPLTDTGDRPFAIAAKPGTVIGVGFESGTRRRFQQAEKKAGESGEGDQGEGGFGGRGFGRRRGGGEREGGRARSAGQSGTFEVWTSLTLATEAKSPN